MKRCSRCLGTSKQRKESSKALCFCGPLRACGGRDEEREITALKPSYMIASEMLLDSLLGAFVCGSFSLVLDSFF